jgi:hypothetical protein
VPADGFLNPVDDVAWVTKASFTDGLVKEGEFLHK